MYWFPTKAIYSAGHVSMVYYPNGPFFLPFAFMLWSLYLMHCYWFWFILRLVWRVVRGVELSDNRDYDDPVEEKKKE